VGSWQEVGEELFKRQPLLAPRKIGKISRVRSLNFPPH